MKKTTITNIVTSWREYLEYRGKTLEQGVTEINKKVGTNVMTNHVSEWAKGTRTIRPEIFSYLVNEVARFAEIQCGFKKLELDNVRAYQQMMNIPERKR